MKPSLLNIMIMIVGFIFGLSHAEARTKSQTLSNKSKHGLKPAADPPSVLPNPNGSQTPVQYGLLGTPRGPCYALGNNGQLTAYVPPNLPQYLWRYNEGIPNLQGSCQGAQPQPIRLFYPRQFLNHEPYEDEDRDLMQQMLPGLMSSMGGMGGGGGGGYGNNGAYGNPGGNGLNSSGGYNGPTNPLLTGTGLIEGLCTAANKEHAQNKQGYCQTLKEALADEASCLHGFLKQFSGRPPLGVEQYCPNYNTIKNDPTNHLLFWQQVLSALAQEESGWDNSKSNTVGENSHGIFMLSPKDISYGCFCRNLNVHDPHSNIKCGATVALTNIAKDGAMGSGHAGTASARGMARYFGPLGDNQANKRNRIQQKTANWCKSATLQRPLESSGAQPEPGAAPPAPTNK